MVGQPLGIIYTLDQDEMSACLKLSMEYQLSQWLGGCDRKVQERNSGPCATLFEATRRVKNTQIRLRAVKYCEKDEIQFPWYAQKRKVGIEI